MKIRPLRLFFSLAFLVTLLTASLWASAQTKPVRVFILAGQSNMEGQGFIAADPKNDTLTITPAFFPMFLEAAGVRSSQKLDGVSLMPALTGKKLAPRSLFWHYPYYGNQGGGMAAAVRDDDWKRIEWFVIERIELYHLRTDPCEQRNVAGQEPGRVKALQGSLHDWQKSVGATFPVKNPNPKSEAK